MPKMTKKGQKFVGREIGRMIRKGPSKGPQKGNKMQPKQAVAVAMNQARKKGYKVPARKAEATLLRGPDYGALALVEVEGGIVVYDHNLIDPDKRSILSVLESVARASDNGDGGTFWEFGPRAHVAVIESNLRRAIRVAGYTEDPLTERAILKVSVAEAVSPDLPAAGGFNIVHEPLEAGLRRHIEMAVATLAEHGRVTAPSVKFYSRPHATDSLGRPLPFMVARAFATGDQHDVQEALREALEPVSAYLVRANVTSHGEDEPHSIDIAIAPPVSVCEAYMESVIPTFEAAELRGSRTLWLKLDKPLGEAEANDINALCTQSTGAVGLRTERAGRAVVAQIPSSADGNYVGDHAFRSRLDWLVGVLEPWGAEVYEIGERTSSITGGAPGAKGRITESDEEIRLAQRAAAMGDVAAAAKLRRLLHRAGTTLRPDLEPAHAPRGLDADAIRDLELYMDNTATLYAQMRRYEKVLARRMMTGPSAKTRGSYRRDLAAKGFMGIIEAGAKDYTRELGGSWHVTFPKKEREFLSMELAKRFERRYHDGELAEAVTEADYTNPSGEKFWGAAGAGVLPIAKNTGRILVGLRSQAVNEPGTWGVFGGAIDAGEEPARAAKREMKEELRYSGPMKLSPAYVFTSAGGGFRFSNFIGVIPDEFEPTLDWETEDTAWLTLEEVKALRPKHFGLKALLKNSMGLIRSNIRGRGRTRAESTDETFRPTNGMTNAAFGGAGAARRCDKCDLGMPKYRGRYPSKCPRCKVGAVVMVGQRVDELGEASVLRMKGKGKGGDLHKPAKNSVISQGGEAPDYDELLQKLKKKLQAKRDQHKAAAKEAKKVQDGGVE